MRKLSALDLAFFIAESTDSPKHVAGLMLFKKPPRSRADFGRKLVDELKKHDRPVEPFNLVIRLTGLTGPRWEACRQFDIEQHVFHHQSGKARTWKQAVELVARLHEPVMDRSRPLWEYHLIDHIEQGRFAVYFKVHHAYADGMTMTTWLNRSLADSVDAGTPLPLWSVPATGQSGNAERRAFSLPGSVRALGGLSASVARTTGGIAKLGAQQLLERTGMTRKNVSLNFDTPHETPLTGSASPGRGIATTFIPMVRIKQVCKATRSTLNHVALSCIDGALHRYLEATGCGVDRPITIQMPVNLRDETNSGSGNRLCVALVELGSPTGDPLLRLQEVGHSLYNVKRQMSNVPGSSMQQYTVMLALAGELLEKLKLSDLVPTNGHTLVSNVPGPEKPLYLKGARLEQMYPISILVPGLRMNITLFSYGGLLNIGIIGTRDLEHMDKLAAYIDEEFELLENALNGPIAETN